MADITVTPGGTYEISIDWGSTGATLGVRVLDNAGATTIARATGFTEYPASSGVYYKTTNTAPTVAGDYTIVVDDDGGTAAIGHVATITLRVTSSTIGAGASPSGRDLCTLADVTALAPGYTSDTDTDDLLQALITAESVEAHDKCQREFVAMTGNTTRRFDIGEVEEHARRVMVGDMTTITTVVIEDYQQSTVQTITSPAYVELSPRLKRTREEWEPCSYLWFPPLAAVFIEEGYVVKVTGTWGFPQIPADLKTAVAKMVLVRYLADAANQGTALSDALNDQGFSVGQAFAAAQSVLRRYNRFP